MVSVGEVSSSFDSDFTVISDWVTIPQTAQMGGVSRQYIHTILDRFPSKARLGFENGPVVLFRPEVEHWLLRRKKDRL